VKNRGIFEKRPIIPDLSTDCHFDVAFGASLLLE
jgi:hypothetical protein